VRLLGLLGLGLGLLGHGRASRGGLETSKLAPGPGAFCLMLLLLLLLLRRRPDQNRCCAAGLEKLVLVFGGRWPARS
jgi:uncharacterized protein (TIGR03382 family)